MFSKKRWNIYGFSKDTVWVPPLCHSHFSWSRRIGNFQSCYGNSMEASAKAGDALRRLVRRPGDWRWTQKQISCGWRAGEGLASYLGGLYHQPEASTASVIVFHQSSSVAVLRFSCCGATPTPSFWTNTSHPHVNLDLDHATRSSLYKLRGFQ